MFDKILVVCHGNICRSPVAEAMLKKALPTNQIRSAGLGAMVDHGADAAASELARADGLDLTAHRAQQIDEEMIQWADLILVMSERQRARVAEIAPAAMGKTFLLGHWLDREIPDPYKKSQDVFQHVHQLIQQSADAWRDRIHR